jgi:hypothetical protein
MEYKHVTSAQRRCGYLRIDTDSDSALYSDPLIALGHQFCLALPGHDPSYDGVPAPGPFRS